MYLKNVVINTASGLKIELSYPKRMSKFEMEYTYIKDLDNKGLNNLFNIESEVVDDLTGKALKLEKDGSTSVEKALFLTKDGRELKLKPLIKCDSVNKDYALSLNLVDKKGNIIEESICELTLEDKKMVHDVFKLSVNEIKEKISNVGDVKVFFFVARDAKDKRKDFFENAICLLKDTCEKDLDDSWREKSFVGKKCLEKLVGASIDKKYGSVNIFENTMKDAFSKSAFSLDVEKIVGKMEETADEFCEFTLESIIVKK